MRIIDIHSHLCSPEIASRTNPRWSARFSDLDELLEAQEEAGVSTSVISSPGFVLEARKESAWLDDIKRYNTYAAELAARYPGRLIGLAATFCFGQGEYLKELERAVKEYGLKGARIDSNVDGEYLDSPRAAGLFALACELDIPLFVHPPGVTMGAEKMQEFGLGVRVGRLMDTTLTIARLVLSGTLEAFPRLKLIFAHMGGTISMLFGRINIGYTLGYARPGEDQMQTGPEGSRPLKKPPSEYVKQIYVDSINSFHPAAALCTVQTLGADHVLFGTDHPPLGVSLRDCVQGVRDLPITGQDKDEILGNNAARLLKL